jgi:sugar-specific transcriptional regulator TrmB
MQKLIRAYDSYIEYPGEKVMDLQDKVDLLIRLGLTPNQAKIYLALSNSSPCTANQISKAACLASEVIYRAMPKLQEKGLIEKEITAPAKFQATPLKLAIEMLLEQKNREDNQTRTKAKKLLANGVEENRGLYAQEDFKITLIPKGERLVQFIEKKLAGIQERLDFVITGQKFFGCLCHKLLQKVVSRKIAVRLAVSGTESEYHTKSLQDFLLNSNLKIRFIHEEIFACVSVLDDRETIINTSAKAGFVQSPIYWSNNPSIVELSKTYFEKFWNQEENDMPPFHHSPNFPLSRLSADAVN